MWIDAAQGLAFARVAAPTADEQGWAQSLAEAIDGSITAYLGEVTLDSIATLEVEASALRAFGYGWKYREAPFGEAQWLDEQGGAVRLASDWIEPIKPILNRYRNVAMMIA